LDPPPPPPSPGLPLDWWVLKKLGCCYTFWFSWLTIWHHVNWNHSPSHTVQVSNRAWNFGNLNPNVDWIVRQALHSTTHVVAPRLIIRTSNEGERKGIVGRYLRLYICEETGQPFFKKKLSNYGYWKSPPKKHELSFYSQQVI